MSNFKTVQEFLKAVPAAMNHEEIYRRHVEEVQNPEKKADLDLSVWESSTVGVGEKNLLRDLRVAEKFICPGFDKKFGLEACSWAKQREKAFGKGSLNAEREYDESFLAEEDITLQAMSVSITDSLRPGVQIPENTPLYQQLIAAVSGVRPNQLSGVAMSFVGERMVTRQDMRHVFLKGYLMVMSYNLATTAGVAEYKFDPVGGKIRMGVSSESKVCLLMRHKIVVDECHFTQEELWVLAEMCSHFPKKRFGEKNIYSGLLVGGDDLVILADDPEFDIGMQPGYGSPERLWADIVSIAIKMNAMEDLAEVVRGMRGVPKLLKELNELTFKSTFMLDFPKSYSISMGVAGLGLLVPTVVKHSGYYATSKCLVADYMLGQMMVMSMYNVAEQMAAFSTIGVPSGMADEDEFFSSLLRQAGLKHDNEDNNMLLQEWRGVRSGSFFLSTGGVLKEAVCSLADEVRNGECSRLRPQLLHALPFSRCTDTTWGTIRGWDYPEYVFEKGREEKIKSNLLLKAFTWVMGVSSKVPKVGLNALGSAFVETLTNEEVKFVQLASGRYDLCLVRFRITNELLGRADEIELSSGHFYSTGFPGARCSIVYQPGGSSEMKVDKEELDESTISAYLGGSDKPGPEENLGHITFGGSKFTPKGGAEGRLEDEGGEQPFPFFAIGANLGKGGQKKDEGEGRGSERPNGVEYSQAKPIRFRVNPPKYSDPSGNVLQNRARTVEGQEIKVGPYVKPAPEEIKSVAGYVIETPGDNRCGVHAIAQDLLLRGFVHPSDKENLFEHILDEVDNVTWQSTSELAGFCNSLGMGLVLIDEENKAVQQWGTLGAFHSVWVHYANGHYSTFIPDDNGNRKFVDLKMFVKATTPEEAKAFIEKNRRAFESEWLQDRWKQFYKKHGYMPDEKTRKEMEQGKFWQGSGRGRGEGSSQRGRGSYGSHRGGHGHRYSYDTGPRNSGGEQPKGGGSQQAPDAEKGQSSESGAKQDGNNRTEWGREEDHDYKKHPYGMPGYQGRETRFW